jgi:hypothetical protein
MVTRSTFEDLSLPHSTGSFFLRPTVILGALLVEATRPPFVGKMNLTDLETEALRDQMVVQELVGHEQKMTANIVRIDEVFARLASTEARKSSAAGTVRRSSLDHTSPAAAAASAFASAMMVPPEKGVSTRRPARQSVDVNPLFAAAAAGLRKPSSNALSDKTGDVELKPLKRGGDVEVGGGSKSAKKVATGLPAAGQQQAAAVSDGSKCEQKDGGGGADDDDNNNYDQWEELEDQTSRKSYFWNKASGETRWDAPPESARLPPAAPEAPVEAARNVPDTFTTL